MNTSNVWIMAFRKITILVIVLTGLGIVAFKSNLSETSESSDLSVLTIDSEGYAPIVVLELFTSQGCSSCPPADNLLDKVKNDLGTLVFPLSYHVDYWNYIGWKDPFSKSKYTEKQRIYNIKFKNRSNYTPQVVVNGMEHFVGSNSAKLYGAINKYGKKKTENSIRLTNSKPDKNNVVFEYSISGSTKDKNLRAILVLNQRETAVKRGENRNRLLTNSNVVVAEKIISIDGVEGRSLIAIPEIVRAHEKISLVLLLETSDYDITAAAQSGLPR